SDVCSSYVPYFMYLVANIPYAICARGHLLRQPGLTGAERIERTTVTQLRDDLCLDLRQLRAQLLDLPSDHLRGGHRLGHGTSFGSAAFAKSSHRHGFVDLVRDRFDSR